MPPPPYGQQPYNPYPAQQGTNGFAIASLVLGLLWFYGVGAILALVFGYMGKRQIDESDGRQQGRGLAIAGIILGWIGLALVVLVTIAIASAINHSDTGGF